MENMTEYGNPYGAGRYRYMRSSEEHDAMMWEDRMKYDHTYNRWIETFGCGYDCGRDGVASMEADEFDLMDFHCEHPLMNCRESFYELTYGDTKESLTYAFFFVQEYVGRQTRDFCFSFSELSMQEANEYIAALEEWHRTGELNVGPYRGEPQYDPWENHRYAREDG